MRKQLFFKFYIKEHETSVINSKRLKRWFKLFNLKLAKRYGIKPHYSNYWQVVNQDNEHVGLLERMV